jgi:hypothetical protein
MAGLRRGYNSNVRNHTSTLSNIYRSDDRLAVRAQALVKYASDNVHGAYQAQGVCRKTFVAAS